MKKQALLIAAALIAVGAAGCASAPLAVDQTQTAEAPHDVPATVDSVSDSSSSVSDPTGGAAPVVEDSSSAAPSSLGASSSGRGH